MEQKWHHAFGFLDQIAVLKIGTTRHLCLHDLVRFLDENRNKPQGIGRTKMKPLRYQGTDRKAYVILIAFLVLVIVARVLLRWPQ